MDTEMWQWVWLAATVVFTVGELASPGTFFMAPFAAGAAVAAVLSFAGVDVAISWAVFLVISLGAFAALRPLARQLDKQGGNPTGVGASRLIGETAVVLESIPGSSLGAGMVRVGAEEWKAESLDGHPVEIGSSVEIVEVRGTRVVVSSVGRTFPSSPPVG